jgi:hypothetical protein
LTNELAQELDRLLDAASVEEDLGKRKDLLERILYLIDRLDQREKQASLPR